MWVGLGWVQKFWVELGFEKVTHDQLCARSQHWHLSRKTSNDCRPVEMQSNRSVIVDVTNKNVPEKNVKNVKKRDKNKIRL